MLSTCMAILLGICGLAWSVEVDDLKRTPFTTEGMIPVPTIELLLEAATPAVPAGRQIDYIRYDERSDCYVMRLVRSEAERFRMGSQTLYEKRNTVWLRLECDLCELTRSTVAP